MNPSSHGPSANRDSFFGGVLRALQRRMRREQFETWFHGFRLADLTEESVEFTVPSIFVRDWLWKNYQADIEAAVLAVDGRRRSVRVCLDDHGGAAHAPGTPRERQRPRQAEEEPEPALVGAVASAEAESPSACADDGPSSPLTNGKAPVFHAARDSSKPRDPYLTKLNKDYIFDQFVVGSCNRLAYAASVGIGENPGRNYNPLFIHGNVGLGKTHLLQATCHSMLRKQRNARVLYLSCEDFANRYIKSLHDKRVDEFRALHRGVDILVLDDVAFLKSKKGIQDEFFHTFNALYNANRQIVISSDLSPPEIPTIEERMVSRFRWGLVAELQKPDFDTRVQIVRRKGRVRGVEFDDEVAQFIAERIDTNIRELEGAVVKVVGFAHLVEEEITLDLAQTALQDVMPHRRPNKVGMPHVMDLITSEFSISPKEIRGKRRTQAVSLPRQIGMYLSRENTEHSLEEIGRFFGNRDHTTVLYAVTKIKNRSKDDRMFRELLRSLNERLLS